MDATVPEKVLKYCPKCGSANFIVRADRSFKCGDCNFHFFVNAASAVAALIINDNGELLLTRRAMNPQKGRLDLPGGFVDPGESAEEALVREIKEELNLQVCNYQYLISYPNEYVFAGYTVYTVDMGFRCYVKDFSVVSSNDDVSDYIFIKPKDVDLSDIWCDSIRRIIGFYIKTI